MTLCIVNIAYFVKSTLITAFSVSKIQHIEDVHEEV